MISNEYNSSGMLSRCEGAQGPNRCDVVKISNSDFKVYPKCQEGYTGNGVNCVPKAVTCSNYLLDQASGVGVICNKKTIYESS